MSSLIHHPLRQQLALVTGGTKGIGLSIAKRLHGLGADVIVLSRSAETLPPIIPLNPISQNKNMFKAFRCDVTCNQDIKLAVEASCKLGTPSILINCAGVNFDRLLVKTSETEIQNILSTNLVGTILMTKEVGKRMLKIRRGCIVNISSVVGIEGSEGQSVYAASKAGVIGFTKSCAKEFGSRSIRVNAIAPGFIKTHMTEDLSEERKEEILENTVLRKFGSPEDVAYAVEFIVLNDFLTGQVIRVDGGLRL